MVRVGLGGACSRTASPVTLCRRLQGSRLRVIVYRKGSDWSRVLVASRDGRIAAGLPVGRYTIAFTWDGAGILSTRGWRPFTIASGRRTRIPPIAPVPVALSIDLGT